MLIVEQYNSLFSLYIYMALVLPIVILSLCGKKSKVLNLFVDIAMLLLLFGLLSLQMWEFVLFLIWELISIYAFYYFRKKCSSEWMYFVIFALSILPLAVVKLCGRTEISSYIGFVGMSYISFKIWELIIEIHDGKIEKLNFLNVLGFLIFAPSFSSGPIGRYPQFIEESEKTVDKNTYVTIYLIPGIKKIILGMFYKFSVAFLINEYVMARYETLSVQAAVVYMYAYTLYLFFDFAGYSMMAVGTGYLMGIKMPDNFNKPFLARNMKEFWERWHISLSTWFNDFLFSRFVLNNVRNGLFKNPKQAARWAYMCTMLVMGFWHGLYLHYILYGFYQGLLLVFTDIWVKSKTYRKVKKMRYYNCVSRFVCFHLIAFGMLIFSGFLIEI